MPRRPLINPKSNEEDLVKLKAILARVKYYPTKIVIHRDADPKYNSSYESIVHTHTQTHDGRDTVANTTCKYFEYEQKQHERPIYRTWVLPGQDEPNEEFILDEIHYEHPIIDQLYLEAQRALHQQQGRKGLYYGGILAGFNDSHESALSVAIRTAFAICNTQKLQPKPAAASAQRSDSLWKKAPEAGGSSAESFDRFSLFPDYLHHLQELDAQSSQLGAHAITDDMASMTMA